MRWLSAITLTCAVVLAALGARADCCRLIKVDAELPPVTLRACEIDASGGCGTVLFLGTLALGESREVCTNDPTILYQEYDDALAEFGPPIRAVCETGVDVEL